MARVLTTAAGIPLLVYIIKFTPDIVCVALVFLVMLLALHEYFNMIREKTRTSPMFRFTAHLAGALILLAFYLPVSEPALRLPLLVLTLGPAAFLMFALFAHNDLSEALHSGVFALFGAAYIGGLLGYIVGLRRIESFGADLVMLLLVIIWVNDIFAYLVGKNFGKHKLAAIVSPKKTVEGAVAGLVSGMIASLAYCRLFLPEVPFQHALVLGAIVGILGQIGDLCESVVKRTAGVKDSGTILPGHGGMLDRIDSLLFGAPAMYYYFNLFLRT